MAVRKGSKKSPKTQMRKKPLKTTTSLAKVVACDHLGFEIRAECNIHKGGNATLALSKPLKANYVYDVTIQWYPRDDDDSSDDEWVHGKVVSAKLKGHANKFRHIRKYAEMCEFKCSGDELSE
eukprot:CAMPEP_0197661578 /NCGR_PEP_ID=MMETSP1338-20131121/51537_1 /TAXON_ID=43686 ORGANISM="Pelagodinium beii, Strain RCC1491" /NCGR_SAMPLE_ID=MMETSP1338 /ASSEMBLY_ACC=CAM_ASM_000754 /LENGTH=122 /DNA_ID=CAMNT_0043239153 /DNA_START=39 /DNA_END=407 /DNA_ORIENTATION=-